MGEGAEDIASSHIGRVFRRLKKARKEGLRPNKGFVASRALMQSDRYHRLLRKHLQLNYRGGA